MSNNRKKIFKNIFVFIFIFLLIIVIAYSINTYKIINKKKIEIELKNFIQLCCNDTNIDYAKIMSSLPKIIILNDSKGYRYQDEKIKLFFSIDPRTNEIRHLHIKLKKDKIKYSLEKIKEKLFKSKYFKKRIKEQYPKFIKMEYIDGDNKEYVYKAYREVNNHNFYYIDFTQRNPKDCSSSQEIILSLYNDETAFSILLPLTMLLNKSSKIITNEEAIEIIKKSRYFKKQKKQLKKSKNIVFDENNCFLFEEENKYYYIYKPFKFDFFFDLLGTKNKPFYIKRNKVVLVPQKSKIKSNINGL